jgi:hypothetical protein
MTAPHRSPSKTLDIPIALLLASGYGGPIVLAVGALGSAIRPPLGIIAALGALAGLAFFLHRVIRGGWRERAVRAAHVLVLGILPLWGLAYSHFLGQPTCSVGSCGADTAVFRPFAEPEVFALLGLHALTALAFTVSRARPGALRPFAEALVHAALLAGAVVHTMIALHLLQWTLLGVAVAPIFLPCAGPPLTVLLYLFELRARLRRRGAEAQAIAPWRVPDSPFRVGPMQEAPPPEPRLHVPSLLRAFAGAPLLLGAHAVIQALWLGRATGALQVFTRTCGYALSSLDVVVVPENCHYLCTVAARGHAFLVRPERLGVRGGVPIVVNRQLAIANAFEDLLHERWPRFGRLARRVYDRVGLPVSRYLQRPLLADMTYLVMKPFEWTFAITLLLLDRGDPEARIDRMYR